MTFYLCSTVTILYYHQNISTCLWIRSFAISDLEQCFSSTTTAGTVSEV